MSLDPKRLIAADRAVRISAEIEVQLMGGHGCTPILAMLVRARDEATQAMVMLVRGNANDPGEIRALQNIVVRFDDLVRWLQDLVRDGFEAEREISNEEREDLADMLAHNPGLLDDQEALEADIEERLHDA